MKKLLFILLSILLFSATQSLANQYTVDPEHSEIGFSVKHMVITNVKGAFREYNAEFKVDTNNKLLSVNADIIVVSVDTRIQKRDDHLRSSDFFEADKYPKITFTATSIVSGTGNKYKVKGDLKIKKTVQEIELDGELTGPVKDPWGNQRMGIILEGQIDRRKFDVTYNKVLETGGLLIDDLVNIHLEGEGILQK
jgi:polyisoprenoid-binding protein YceI